MIDMIHICIALIHLQEMGTVTEPLAQGGAPRNDILDLLRTNGISVKGNYTKWRGKLAIIFIDYNMQQNAEAKSSSDALSRDRIPPSNQSSQKRSDSGTSTL